MDYFNGKFEYKVDELINYSSNKRLVKLFLFLKFIIDNSTDSEAVTLAIKLLDNVKSIPQGALSAVLTDCSFGYWVYLSDCLKNRIKNGEEIPDSDIPQLSYFKIGMDPLKFLLFDLKRWVLSAHLITRQEYQDSFLFLNSEMYIPIYGITINGFNNQVASLSYKKNHLIIGSESIPT